MRATSPMRLHASARVHSISSADSPDLPLRSSGQKVPALRTPAAPGRRRGLPRFLVSLLVLSVIWGALTDWRADALVFGVPAVLLGASVAFLLPQGYAWRLSPRGAALFALWFAVQSVRGAIDVAMRAFAPRMPLRPGFRHYDLTLPMGAPRVMFINAITLLPGTLSAEIEGHTVIVHMLDTRIDLDPALDDLETQIRALFALPQNTEASA